MTPETPPPSASIDVQVTPTEPGPASGHPGPSPAAARPVSRWTVALALGVALLGLAVAVFGLVDRTRTITTTTHTQAAVPLGVDASGCPLGRPCLVSSVPEPALLAVVDRALGFPTVISPITVSDELTSVTYRATLTAVLDGDRTVTTTAQCVPGGAVVPARSAALRAFGPATRAVVVPGEAGCSLAVVVRAPAGDPVPAAAIDQITHDPSAQLRSGR
jgi:hypothetical protein